MKMVVDKMPVKKQACLFYNNQEDSCKLTNKQCSYSYSKVTGKPCCKYLTDFSKSEEEIWLEFYCTFNDENLNHAKNAFATIEDNSEESLFLRNKEWVKTLKENGFDESKIISLMPNAKKYL